MSYQHTEVSITSLRHEHAITIRPLDDDDYQALLAFGAALPQDDLLYLQDDFQNPDIIRRLVNAAAAENWRQIVAVVDGAIVGYSAVRRLPGWSSHVADISMIVSDGWRRKRLGTLLAQAIFDAARDLKVDKVIVEMLERQNAGRAIFERLGFHVEGILSLHARDRHGQRHNLLILAYHVS